MREVMAGVGHRQKPAGVSPDHQCRPQKFLVRVGTGVRTHGDDMLKVVPPDAFGRETMMHRVKGGLLNNMRRPDGTLETTEAFERHRSQQLAVLNKTDAGVVAAPGYPKYIHCRSTPERSRAGSLHESAPDRARDHKGFRLVLRRYRTARAVSENIIEKSFEGCTACAVLIDGFPQLVGVAREEF